MAGRVIVRMKSNSAIEASPAPWKNPAK